MTDSSMPSAPADGAHDPRRPTLTRLPFGVAPDGTPVELFTLRNVNGLDVRIMSYGGIVVSLRTADREGRTDDIVLGYDDLDSYRENDAYIGALIGRVGNRIAHGRFSLDGTDYRLATNDGDHHLHGGLRGFDQAVWTASAGGPTDDNVSLSLTHSSPHGDEGYAGRLDVQVTYTLTADNSLRIDYRATADRATPINLTHHGYFNLAGTGSRGPDRPSLADVLAHRLTIHADHYTPTGPGQIPTGTIARVDGTPFDFRTPRTIGDRIDADEPDLRRAGGYDHNFVLRRAASGLTHAARVAEPVTGRVLDVYTTEPGVQFYSGNYLDGTRTGKAGRRYGRRSGFCLETQHFPDAPNQPAFPSIVLAPDDEYRSTTVFAFGTDLAR